MIVEDHKDARGTIRLGIEKYNASGGSFELIIIAETDSYKSVEAFINSYVDSIHLVFLDIALEDGTKKGIDLCMNYPDFAYIVVSKDKSAIKEITNQTEAGYYYYVEKAAKGAFTSDNIVESIQTFLKKKGDGLYNNIIKLGWQRITVDRITFISKIPLRIEIGTNGQRVITECTTCMLQKISPPHSTHSFYLCSNIVDNSMDHGCFLRLYEANRTDSGLTISGFVKEYNLNPNNFAKISPAVIVNLRKVELINASGLHIRVDRGTAIFNVDPRYRGEVTEKMARISSGLM
jgi:hypothetical protein